jgi:hypothetical protein
MHLAVTCKNWIDPDNNRLQRYRIPVPDRPTEKFTLACDYCGKTYLYDPEDVLEMAV